MHKSACITLNYIEHFSCFSFFNYWMYFRFCLFSVVGISIGSTSFAIGLKICAIAASIKNYQSIIKRKKKNKYDKKVLLVKSKLSNIEVLISKALIDRVINHDEFVLINNVPKEYEEMKE